jgi:hypothetical protein
MQKSKHKTSLLPQLTIVALIQSIIWMGGICTIFDCLFYSLQWLLPHSLDTDLFTIAQSFPMMIYHALGRSWVAGMRLIMSKSCISVLDSAFSDHIASRYLTDLHCLRRNSSR